MDFNNLPLPNGPFPIGPPPNMPPPNVSEGSSNAASEPKLTVPAAEMLSTETSEEPIDLGCPPERTFESFHKLMDFVHNFTEPKGYEVVQARPRYTQDKSGKKHIYARKLFCSRSRKSQNTRRLQDETRVRRNPNFKRIGCKFNIIAAAVDPKSPDGQWQLRHSQHVTHNHGPDHAKALVGVRQRSRRNHPEVMQLIQEQLAAGKGTAQILKVAEERGLLIEAKDIHNIKASNRANAKNNQPDDQANQASQSNRPTAPFPQGPNSGLTWLDETPNNASSSSSHPPARPPTQPPQMEEMDIYGHIVAQKRWIYLGKRTVDVSRQPTAQPG